MFLMKYSRKKNTSIPQAYENNQISKMLKIPKKLFLATVPTFILYCLEHAKTTDDGRRRKSRGIKWVKKRASWGDKKGVTISARITIFRFQSERSCFFWL